MFDLPMMGTVLDASGVGTILVIGALLFCLGVTICRMASLIDTSVDAEHCANP